jgi:hypothetical protein
MGVGEMADQFLTLKTRDDLQRLVDEGLEESLTLDYKASAALSRESGAVNELCKDVSAFANSAGGQIIYCIEENRTTHKPEKIDEGVTDSKVTREWIEQTLNSRVQPRMHGIRVERIELSDSGYGYVLTIPSTSSGPHQAPDKKYYRRFELQSVPMEDYEIRDVIQRRAQPQPFVNIALPSDPYRISWNHEDGHSTPIKLELEVGNRTSEPALYTFVQLVLDYDFVINSSGSPDGHQQGTFATGEMAHVIVFKMAVPGHFPLFKEVSFALGKGTRISIPPKYRDQDSVRYLISYVLTTPGYSERRSGWFIQKGDVLTLKWELSS